MAAFWPIGTAQIIRIVSYPIRKKSRFWLFCMWSVKEMYHALLPKTDYRDKGRGHDRRLEKTGPPFQMFCCSRKFSDRTTQKVVFHLLSNRIFRKILVNGKQPVCTLPMVSCGSSPVTSVSRSLLPCKKRSAWGAGWSGASNQNIVQNHLNIALLNVF